MSKPTKPAQTEGDWPTLYERFLLPLTRYKPADMSLRIFWEALFCLDSRSILRYRARHKFELPGLYYVAGLVKHQGIGPRHVQIGDTLWVRTDSTTPNSIDIELFGVAKHGVYQLSLSEYNSIAAHLELDE